MPGYLLVFNVTVAIYQRTNLSATLTMKTQTIVRLDAQLARANIVLGTTQPFAEEIRIGIQFTKPVKTQP